MQGQYDIGAIIRLDGEGEYKAAVTSVNKSSSALRAELNLVKEQYDGQANSLEALTKKQEIYAKIVEAQKTKVEKTNDGLENAKRVYSNLEKNVQRASQALADAQKRLDAAKTANDQSSDAVKRNEQEVEELQRALEKGNANLEKQSGRVQDWETKLRSAEAQVLKANRQLDENAKYLREAEKATDGHATSIDGYGKKVKEASEVTLEWTEALKAGAAGTAIAAGVSALKSAGEASVGVARDLEKAGNQIEASTEVTGEALSRYKDVLAEVYAANFGDNLEDVSDVISRVTQVLGELNQEDLRNVTEGVITLRDTFDSDVQETIRGVRSLMYQFGLSASEAIDLFGAGAKAGLDYTDELGDNVSEYAGNFAQAGYSAKEYFQLLKNGSSNGAYNLDKVNDAINEVTNRLADGTVEKAIGSYSEDTQSFFRAWQTGEVTQKQVIDSIVADIQNCTNEQEALTMAATAFGTMGEDGNLRFVESLSSVGDSFEDVRGKMEEIKNVKYSDAGSQIAELGRSIQMQLVDRMQLALPVLQDGLEVVEGNLDGVIAGVTGLGTAIGLNKLFKSGFFTAAVKGTADLAEGLGKAETAQKLLNLTSSTTPWGAIAGAIGLATAALVAYTIATNDAKTEAEKQSDAIDDLADAAARLKGQTQESKAAFEESKSGIEAEYRAVQIMSGRLQHLAESEETSNAKKAEMRALVDQLNGAIPGLNLALDEQTGKLNQNSEAIQAYIEQAKQQATMDAFGDRINEIASEIAEANVTVTEAEQQRAEALAEVTALEKEREELLKNSPEVTDAVSLQIEELNQQIAMYKDNAEECNRVIAEQEEASAASEKEMDSLAKTMEVVNEKAEDATDSTNEYKNAIDATAVSVETQQQALETLQERYEEIKSSIRDGIESKIDLFSAFDGGEESSLDTMLENLDSQLEGLENWKSNMERLAGEVGNTIGSELYEYLADMGPEAANAVDEMVDALDSGGADKLRAISEKYAEALDFSDEASSKLAAAQSAISAVLGNMGSSDADFSGLRDSIHEAVDSAAGGWADLPDKTEAYLEQAIQVAKECGANIPEGLAEGIQSGEVSPQDAISQLNGSLQGQFDFLEGLARDAGLQIPEDIQAGISQGGSAAIQAVSDLVRLITAEQQKAEKPSQESGKKNMQAAGSGMTSQAGAVSSAAGSVAQGAANTMGGYVGSFRSVGTNLMQGTTSGIVAGSPAVSAAAENAVADALNAAKAKAGVKSPSTIWRKDLGQQLAKGAELGILDGTAGAAKAAENMAEEVTSSAKKTWEINSPSKIFKAFGENLAESTNIGIVNKKGKAKKAAKGMAQEVYNEAAAWVKEYKKTHSVSLSDESTFWKQLAKVVKNDSKAYQEAISKATQYDGYKESVSKKVEKAFGVSWNTKSGKKEASAYYSEVLKAAKTYLENLQADQNLSLQQEKWYWQQVKSSLQKGTQAYADAAKKVKNLSKEIKKENATNKKELKEAKQEAREFGLSGNALDMYKTYYEVSAKAEVEYWDIVRKQYKKGSAERIEADKKWVEAEESYYDKMSELNENMQDEIAELTDSYQEAFAERKDAIKSSFGLFDEFTSEAESPDTLLANMQSQVAGYTLWIQQLEELAGKSILNDSFLDELREMGPEAAATIVSLNMMTEEQLRAANEAYETKDRLAEAQAARETESLRKETEERIRAVKESYEKEAAALSESIEKPLRNLAKKASTIGETAAAKLIKGIGDKAKAKSTTKDLQDVTNQIKKGFDGLPKAGRDIGKETLAGIIKGLNNSLTIKAGATEFAAELEKQVRKSLDINSPSKRFEDAVGVEIPAGVAKGIEKNTTSAARAGEEMAQETLERARAQLASKEATLQVRQEIIGDYSVSGNGGGESADGIIAAINDLGTEIQRMKLVLNTGELVGAIAGGVGNELAARSRRW